MGAFVTILIGLAGALAFGLLWQGLYLVFGWPVGPTERQCLGLAMLGPVFAGLCLGALIAWEELRA